MFFSDSWISKNPIEDIEKSEIVAPSQDPNRADALLLHYVNTDSNGMLLKTAMLCQEYENVDGKIVYSERNLMITDNTIHPLRVTAYVIGSRIADAVSNNDWA